MKVEASQLPSSFNPITLRITIENKQGLDTIMAMMGVPTHRFGVLMDRGTNQTYPEGNVGCADMFAKAIIKQLESYYI